jgi:hypothetical protein
MLIQLFGTLLTGKRIVNRIAVADCGNIYRTVVVPWAGVANAKVFIKPSCVSLRSTCLEGVIRTATRRAGIPQIRRDETRVLS